MQRGTAGEVFRIFLRLGCTSFGGPVAHIGIFRAEIVGRLRWIEEAAFADLVALCQFLPGPASSQLGMALGLLRAGPLGMLAAWTGFTMPSAIVMALAAWGVAAVGDLGHAGWLHGLKLVAVAVVAQAVWGMARALCPDRPRATVAVIAALLALAEPNALGQIGAIVLGGIAGTFVLARPPSNGAPPTAPLAAPVSRLAAGGALVAFFVLLLGLPVLADATGTQAVRLVSAFYRAGALVFGGGHVVLPLLQDAVVPTGWVGQDSFLAGYGAAQAMPGPLFTFAAYLGAASLIPPGGVIGAVLALAAIFLPSFLLVTGALPLWGSLRTRSDAQALLRGVNAAVVGLLVAALYTPVWTSAVTDAGSFGLALAAFLALTAWAVPPWIVVAAGSVVGWGLTLL